MRCSTSPSTSRIISDKSSSSSRHSRRVAFISTTMPAASRVHGGSSTETARRISSRIAASFIHTETQRHSMAKYLVTADYKSKGTQGVIKEGGSARRAEVKHAVEALGGKVEAFYFAYGHVDAYVLVDLPDANAGIALSLAVNAS